MKRVSLAYQGTTLVGVTMLFGAFITLTACTDTVRQPLTESERDIRGVYDGRWIAHVSKPAKTQHVAQWVFTCPGEAYDLPFIVRGGRLQLADGETWVNRDGKFRLEVPSDRKLKESAGSGDSISRGQVTIILQGSLAGNSPSGYITAGVEQFGNNGCSSKVRYERRGGTRA